MAGAELSDSGGSSSGPLERSLDAAAAVATAAEAELDSILAEIGSWVDRDSPTGHRELLDSMAEVLAEACEGAGMNAELVPGHAGLHLHAAIDGEGEARIALLGHHDTVFAPGTAAMRRFEVAGGRAIGPGVADMKGGIGVGMHAARLLTERGGDFGWLELVSVPDEERRSAPFATLDRLREFDAVLCFECGRPGGAIVTERKGAVWLDVEATGRAAHAGVSPESGRNAIAALCREAVRIGSLSGSRPGLTVELTEFSGGESGNSVAAKARLTADVRAWTEEELTEAIATIGAFAEEPGLDFELVETAATPPLVRTPVNAELASRAIEIADSLGSPIAEVSTGGVSDACWTAAVGVPTLDGLGPVGDLDHTPEEYIQIDSIPARCGLVAGLITEIEARKGAP